MLGARVVEGILSGLYSTVSHQPCMYPHLMATLNTIATTIFSMDNKLIIIDI